MVAEDPQLPLELEREIFETTARLHPDMRYTLLFVARRVLIWIEPLLYRTLVFPYPDQHRLSTLLAAKPPEFFAKTTRHVSLSDPLNSGSYAVGVLELCTGVTHLALDLYEINYEDVLRSPFRALQQLRRLALYPGNVLLAAARDATVPLFPSLTHLHLFDDNGDNLKLLCAALPALTHIAVDGESFAWLRADIVLADCAKLTLFVFVASRMPSAVDMDASVLAAGLSDPRVVVTWYKTWNESALEGYNFWDAATDFAARKRQGLIKESCFLAERD
ncbi:hypothetical protein C8F01DRAFT_1370430 [Mycena amicta]|nr:hypothetical protein C8F01DRAFT_1370430 [Mycena amicta]